MRHRPNFAALLLALALCAVPAIARSATPRLVRVPLAGSVSLQAVLEAGLDVVEVHGADAVVILEWPGDEATLARLGAAPQLLDADRGNVRTIHGDRALGEPGGRRHLRSGRDLGDAVVGNRAEIGRDPDIPIPSVLARGMNKVVEVGAEGDGHHEHADCQDNRRENATETNSGRFARRLEGEA